MAAGADDESRRAYKAIINAFESHQNVTLELEILPSAVAVPEGELILQDGRCIGIPKKVLVHAFIRARALFFECRLHRSITREALVATKIMLLFDPEHITAANYRKKHLLELHTSCTGGVANGIFEAIREERLLLDSILTSPLHRQTKSPTLWSHRRWLVSTFYQFLCNSRCSGTHGEEKSIELAEFRSVFQAGERHSNNYYAWRYARDLVALEDCRRDGIAGTDRATSFRSLTEAVLNWCLSHPSDVSGWSFLSFVLQRPEQGRDNSQRILSKVISFALDFRLAHESLWVFIRTVLAMDSVLPKTLRIEEVRKIRHFIAEEGERASAFIEKVRTALLYIERLNST